MNAIEMKTITMRDAHIELSQYRNISYASFTTLISQLTVKRKMHKAGKGLISLEHWQAYINDIAERQKIKKAEWIAPGFPG